MQDIVCTDSLDTAESEINSDYDEESLDVANEGGIDWESYFKKAINDEEFDLYRTPEIKDYIIENYSQAYYDKMIDYAQIGSRPEYNEEERRYEYEIGQQHYVPYNYSALYFYPETGSVEVCLYEDGIICMKNGQKDLESYKNELKSQAINLTDLYDSYNNKVKENQYREKFHIFKVRLAKIARSKDYKYVISAESELYDLDHNHYPIIYTDDDNFVELDYPCTVYVQALFRERRFKNSDAGGDYYYYFTDASLLIK